MKKLLYILLLIPALSKAAEVDTLPLPPTLGWNLFNGLSLGSLSGNSSTLGLSSDEGMPVANGSGHIFRKVGGVALGLSGTQYAFAGYPASSALGVMPGVYDSSGFIGIGIAPSTYGLGNARLNIQTQAANNTTNGATIWNSSRTVIFHLVNDGGFGFANDKLSFSNTTNILAWGAAGGIGTVPGNSFSIYTNNTARASWSGAGVLSLSYVPKPSTTSYTLIAHAPDSSIVQVKLSGFTLSGDTLYAAVAAGAPFSDATALVKNSADATKLGKFDASGITTGTTRTYSLPDFNGIFAVTNHAQTWTGAQDMTGATVTVTTPSPGDNTTKVPTTAFVTAAVAAISNPSSAGVYKPTITNSSNAGTITSDTALYTRVGNNVTVDGKVDIAPTSGSVNTSVDIPLPVNSQLTGGHACWGTGMTSQTTNGGIGGVVFSSGTVNTARLIFYATGQTTTVTIYYHFQYNVQ